MKTRSDYLSMIPQGGYPVIRGNEDLNALPLNSVILDMGGLPRQATARTDRINMWDPGTEEGYFSTAELIAHVRSCGVDDSFLVLYVEDDIDFA